MDNSMSNYYEYKGNFYKSYNTVLMKCPTTRDWVKAVRYEGIESDFNIIFIREVDDFNSKFKRITRKELEKLKVSNGT